MDVADIIAELDEHGFEDVTEAEKVRAIQGTIWQVEGMYPWPFLEQSINLDFAGSADTASNFPGDFRATVRLKDLTTGLRLLPLRLEEFEDRVGTEHSQAGDPRLYYFEGTSLKVWPLPAVSTGRVKMRYIRWSDEITAASVEADILFPKYFHREVIANGALSRMYEMEDDPELASRFEQRQDKAIQLALEALFKRQYDRPDVIEVVDQDWDDYSY